MLGLAEGSIRSFVLENDPVPRALLSVDPTFTALKNSRPGAALLQLRHWLLGPGVPLTPDRFLADNVGEVNLLRWAPDSGHRVRISFCELSVRRAAAGCLLAFSKTVICSSSLCFCSLHLIQSPIACKSHSKAGTYLG